MLTRKSVSIKLLKRLIMIRRQGRETLCCKKFTEFCYCLLCCSRMHLNNFWPLRMGIYNNKKCSVHKWTQNINMDSLPWLHWPQPWMQWCWGWGVLHRLAGYTTSCLFFQFTVQARPPKELLLQKNCLEICLDIYVCAFRPEAWVYISGPCCHGITIKSLNFLWPEVWKW